MTNSKTLRIATALVLLFAGSMVAKDVPLPNQLKASSSPTTPLSPVVSLKLSGPGAVNDSTIKAGQKVSVDMIWENKGTYMGFSCGLKISSPDIVTIVHPADSGKGVNKHGDIKGYAGWESRGTIWDFGLWPSEVDWDGQLPELLGFGGACVKTRFSPIAPTKVLSFDMVVPTAGTLYIDSSNAAPYYFKVTRSQADAGDKLPMAETPVWKGPYKYKVIK